MVEKKLSKKEQKALAFRKKGKKNADVVEPQAVPESDLIDENATTPSGSKATGKRAREDGESGNPDDAPVEKKKKKNRRPKKKNASHTGYIIFVGNLPFDTTKTELEKHFESAEGLLSTRLMTDKQTKEPKGFAFLEFKDSDCLQKALKFHHTLFKRRQINVELTAGGGGKSEARQEKLQVKREKLRTERQKVHEKSIAPANAARVASSYARRQASEQQQEEEKAKKRQKYSATGVNAIGAEVQMRKFPRSEE